MSEIPKLQVVTQGYQAATDQQANEVLVRLPPNDLDKLRQILRDRREGVSVDRGMSGGGGMGDSDRITRLETHFEYIKRDLSDLKSGQQGIGQALASISTRLDSLPTKTDLSSWRTQWIAICVGAIALIVGGIIGGLSWIKPDAPSVIIRSDNPQASSVPSANNRPTPSIRDAPAPRP